MTTLEIEDVRTAQLTMSLSKHEPLRLYAPEEDGYGTVKSVQSDLWVNDSNTPQLNLLQSDESACLTCNLWRVTSRLQCDDQLT